MVGDVKLGVEKEREKEREKLKGTFERNFVENG